LVEDTLLKHIVDQKKEGKYNWVEIRDEFNDYGTNLKYGHLINFRNEYQIRERFTNILGVNLEESRSRFTQDE